MISLVVSFSSIAQDKSPNRKEYENWKQNVLPTIGKKNTEQPHIYIFAKVQRLDAKTGEIQLALAQQSSDFKVEIQPLETEKMSDGKMVTKQVGEKSTISTRSLGLSEVQPKMNYSEPSITFLTEENANAVEVILYDSTTKSVNKLVLPFTDKPSNGVLTSVEN
jgi:hypothetical protein